MSNFINRLTPYLKYTSAAVGFALSTQYAMANGQFYGAFNQIAQSGGNYYAEGWVCDSTNTGRDLNVRLLINGNYYTEAPVTLPSDSKVNAVCGSGNFNFSIPIEPAVALASQLQSLSVRLVHADGSTSPIDESIKLPLNQLKAFNQNRLLGVQNNVPLFGRMLSGNLFTPSHCLYQAGDSQCTTKLSWQTQDNALLDENEICLIDADSQLQLSCTKQAFDHQITMPTSGMNVELRTTSGRLLDAKTIGAKLHDPQAAQSPVVDDDIDQKPNTFVPLVFADQTIDYHLHDSFEVHGKVCWDIPAMVNIDLSALGLKAGFGLEILTEHIDLLDDNTELTPTLDCTGMSYQFFKFSMSHSQIQQLELSGSTLQLLAEAKWTDYLGTGLTYNGSKIIEFKFPQQGLAKPDGIAYQRQDKDQYGVDIPGAYLSKLSWSDVDGISPLNNPSHYYEIFHQEFDEHSNTWSDWLEYDRSKDTFVQIPASILAKQQRFKVRAVKGATTSAFSDGIDIASFTPSDDELLKVYQRQRSRIERIREETPLPKAEGGDEFSASDWEPLSPFSADSESLGGVAEVPGISYNEYTGDVSTTFSVGVPGLEVVAGFHVNDPTTLARKGRFWHLSGLSDYWQFGFGYIKGELTSNDSFTCLTDICNDGQDRAHFIDSNGSISNFYDDLTFEKVPQPEVLSTGGRVIYQSNTLIDANLRRLIGFSENDLNFLMVLNPDGSKQVFESISLIEQGMPTEQFSYPTKIIAANGDVMELKYQVLDAGQWKTFGHCTSASSNCLTTGATITLTGTQIPKIRLAEVTKVEANPRTLSFGYTSRLDGNGHWVDVLAQIDYIANGTTTTLAQFDYQVFTSEYTAKSKLMLSKVTKFSGDTTKSDDQHTLYGYTHIKNNRDFRLSSVTLPSKGVVAIDYGEMFTKNCVGKSAELIDAHTFEHNALFKLLKERKVLINSITMTSASNLQTERKYHFDYAQAIGEGFDRALSDDPQEQDGLFRVEMKITDGNDISSYSRVSYYTAPQIVYEFNQTNNQAYCGNALAPVLAPESMGLMVKRSTHYDDGAPNPTGTGRSSAFDEHWQYQRFSLTNTGLNPFDNSNFLVFDKKQQTKMLPVVYSSKYNNDPLHVTVLLEYDDFLSPVKTQKFRSNVLKDQNKLGVVGDIATIDLSKTNYFSCLTTNGDCGQSSFAASDTVSAADLLQNREYVLGLVNQELKTINDKMITKTTIELDRLSHDDSVSLPFKTVLKKYHSNNDFYQTNFTYYDKSQSASSGKVASTYLGQNSGEKRNQMFFGNYHWGQARTICITTPQATGCEADSLMTLKTLDNYGNIHTVTENEVTTEYQYDLLSRKLQEKPQLGLAVNYRYLNNSKNTLLGDQLISAVGLDDWQREVTNKTLIDGTSYSYGQKHYNYLGLNTLTHSQCSSSACLDGLRLNSYFDIKGMKIYESSTASKSGAATISRTFQATEHIEGTSGARYLWTVESQNGDAITTLTVADSSGRIVQSAQDKGSLQGIKYFSDRVETNHSYDPFTGHWSKVIEPVVDGVKTHLRKVTSNLLGQMVKEEHPEYEAPVIYQYSPIDGKLTKEYLAAIAPGVANNGFYEFGFNYDDYGRLVEKTCIDDRSHFGDRTADANDPAQSIVCEQYEYHNHRLKRESQLADDGMQQPTHIVYGNYDQMNRPRRYQVKLPMYEGYTQSQTENDGGIDYCINAEASDNASSTKCRVYDFDFNYDNKGRVDKITYPQVTLWQTDAQGALNPQDKRFNLYRAFFDNGLEKQIELDDRLLVSNATLDPRGKITGYNIDGLSASIAYDVLDRLQSNELGGVWRESDITYDVEGFVTGYSLAALAETHTNVLTSQQDVSFVYNDKSMLSSMNLGTLASFDYSYDELGNQTSVTQTVAPGATGLSITDGTTTTGYQDFRQTNASYNGKGGLLEDERHVYRYSRQGQVNFIRDAANRNDKSNWQIYLLDAKGRRVVKQKMDKSAFTIYGPEGIVLMAQEFAANDFVNQGNVLATRLYLPFNGSSIATLKVAEQAESKLTFNYKDRMNNPVVTWQEGASDYQYQLYSPFGKQLIASNKRSGAHGFTGHIENADNGIIDMKARNFDSFKARFNRPDPARDFSKTLPTSYNLYQYVRNNPVNKFDPNGESEVDKFINSETWKEIKQANEDIKNAMEGEDKFLGIFEQGDNWKVYNKFKEGLDGLNKAVSKVDTIAKRMKQLEEGEIFVNNPTYRSLKLISKSFRSTADKLKNPDTKKLFEAIAVIFDAAADIRSGKAFKNGVLDPNWAIEQGDLLEKAVDDLGGYRSFLEKYNQHIDDQAHGDIQVEF